MKLFLTLLTFTSLLLAACSGNTAPEKDEPVRASNTATQTAQPIKTSTSIPIGTWETVIDGVIYDKSAGPDKPIAGASISYHVVHSYFLELQEGRPNKIVTDGRGKFSLPVIVHDTDSIRILIEAQGFISYEESLVGVNLFGGRSFNIGLTPLATPTVSPR